MIRKTFLFASILLMTGTVSAQSWIDQGPFPDSTSQWRGGHGVAVDAENKVWVIHYYPDFRPAVIAGDTLKNAEGGNIRLSGIAVYNSDGTKSEIGPIHSFVHEGVGDTLFWDAADGLRKDLRGIKADHNGDIIVVLGGNASTMYRLNHKTGAVMNRIGDLRFGSPASPGVDAAGNIYVAPVIADAPISIFNSDFRWIGNVSLSSPGIGRSLEVSADGNTVYWASYTERGIYKYHREDEFSQFDSLGLIHEGMIVTSAARHPATGYIWLGHSIGENDAVADTAGMFGPESELTWFAIDPGQDDMIVDQIEFDSPFTYCGSGLNRDARAVGFSPDGIYAYVGIFDVIQGLDAAGDCVFLAAAPNRGFIYKKFMRGMVTGIDRDPAEIPDEFTLSQNYPNPFNPQTNIAFELKEAGLATLKVYDVLGREVVTLVDEHLIAGKYTATFNATDLSSGTYVYQLNVAGQRLSGTMTLVR